MRKVIFALLILLAGAVSWQGLAGWCPGGSERFYLLVPPVYMALYVLLSPRGGRGLRSRVRPALLYLAVMAAAYSAFQIWTMSQLAPGGRLMRGVSLWEAVVTVYFLGALALVLAMALSLSRIVCRGCDELLFGSSVEVQKRWPRRRYFMRHVLAVLLLVPIAPPYLGGVAYVHRLKQPNLTTPQELLGRAYEDIAFTTADGMKLRGWFIPARESAARTLLICHGLGINRGHVLSYAAIGDELHANVFLFDFRGHGDSGGHTTSIGYREKLDVLAAVDYLRRERPGQARSLIGLGISMGAATLTRAAAEVEPPFAGLILDSGFTSTSEVAEHMLPFFPAWLRHTLIAPGLAFASLHAGCELRAVRPIDHAAKLRAPVLFIHARGDRLVPVEHARRLFAEASEPKALWIAETGDHCSAWNARHLYGNAVRRLDQFRLTAEDAEVRRESPQ